MPRETEFQDYLYKVYSAFLRGRLCSEPSPEYDALELTAHALGVERVGIPLPNTRELSVMVTKLLAPDVPPSAPSMASPNPVPTPEKSATAPKQLSQRVLEILGELGLSPSDFHKRGATTPTSARAQLARRMVILRLRDEGLCAREIAAATLLDPWTIRSHIRAARKSAA